jgi:hypothetical protein
MKKSESQSAQNRRRFNRAREAYAPTTMIKTQFRRD